MRRAKVLLTNLPLWLVVLLALIWLYSKFDGRPPAVNMEFGEYRDAVASDRVEEVQSLACEITGRLRGGQRFRTAAPIDPDVTRQLREKGVTIALPAQSE